MRRGRVAAGFTLLEVMLAMTALALVTAVSYGAFHLGIRAVERGEMAVVTSQRLRVAADVLIRQIKSVVKYGARTEDEEVFTYFIGSATSMTFITANGLQGGGGLMRVVYQVMDDPMRLVVTETPFFSPDALGRDMDQAVTGRSAVLLDNFTSLTFEYYYDGGGIEEDAKWLPAWDPRDGDTENMVPTAVRVVVQGLSGLGGEPWGQEIPVMSTRYGEKTGEGDDEAAAEDADDDDTGEDAVTGTPATAPNTGVHRQAPAAEDAEEADD